MATPPGPVRRSPSLAPSRWPALPRRGTALRLALATLLLALAAGVLYAREPRSGCPGTEVTTPGPDAAASPAPSDPGDPSTGPRTPGPDDSRLPLPAGTVGVPIRLAEPAALAVVRPGARVDLLVVPDTGTASRSTGPALVAARALVLDVLTADTAVDGSSALYLALPPDEAHRAVALPDGTRFAVMVRD